MKLTRRAFLRASAAGAALAAGSGLSAADAAVVEAAAGSVGGNSAGAGTVASSETEAMESVTLGRSGVRVTRLALGTGTHGWKQQSNQTRIGRERFVELARTAYDSGVRFFDMADIYGTHTFFRDAFRHIPREKVVILSKMWTSRVDFLPDRSPAETLDRFRKEVGTDYLDIVLIHCMVDSDWPEKVKPWRDFLSEAREKGLVRTFGISCHHLDALKTAAADSWTEVLLARINSSGALMDDRPETVMPVLKQAHDAGKGILGMKIFGCGALTGEADRTRSLSYVLGSGVVDAMTIGMEKPEQVADNIAKIRQALSGS